MDATVVAIIGLTAIVAALVGVLIFAVLRFASAARDSRRALRENSTESAFVTAALHDALTKLKVQEREMSARAEASERFSSEIVESLSSGLLVVASDGRLRILNPAGRRLLNLPDTALMRMYRDVLPAPLARGHRGVSSRRRTDRQTPAFRWSRRALAGISRRQRVAALRRSWRIAWRDLPVHRPDSSRRNAGTAATEGESRAGW